MGDITFSDKRHLFPLSSENTVYTPGHALPPTIRFRGWNIKIVVCYDLRFPVWTRNQPDNLYDLLIVPSNWPISRVKPYKTLLSARAIENQIYTIGCNRTGVDKYGDYTTGMSSIFDNLGEDIKERPVATATSMHCSTSQTSRKDANASLHIAPLTISLLT